MQSEQIKLTPQELDDIKDDVRFRYSITLSIKTLTEKLDKMELAPRPAPVCEEKFRSMGTMISWLWGIVSAISIGVVARAVFILTVRT